MPMTDELDYRFIVDQMLWSFSRITSFEQCPYEWKLKYIDAEKGENSFFGQFGSFIHKILELYEKGELSLFDISIYYEEHFGEEVSIPPPPNQFVDIGESYYNKGLAYLDNIDLVLEDYDILGIEKEVRFKVGPHDMIGYIDLLLRHKTSDEIIILDHKSATLKFKKDGNLSKTSIPQFQEFKKQLYLYSIPVITEYGHVDRLKWNLFKDRRDISVPWIEQEYIETKEWAEKTINEILSVTEYPARPDDYYCWNLCTQRHNGCPYKPLSKRDRELLAANVDYETML